MNKKYFFYLLFSLTIALSACKRHKIAKSTPNESVGNLQIQELQYTYFTSRAKVNYEDGSTNMGFTITIRMKKDSAIWLSASPALGIEAARILITPDSIKIMNRLNATYSKYGFDFLQKKYNVDVSFSNLQNMLVGNLVVPKSLKDNVNIGDIPECAILVQENGKFQISNVINTKNHKVINLIINKRTSSEQLKVNYSEFAALDTFLFPYENVITATVASPGQNRNIKISIHHNKAEISGNPLNFTFNVPKKFERR